MKITNANGRTYGTLYKDLCCTTSDIPIGIYRTQNQSSGSVRLGIDPIDDKSEERRLIKYVIINPCADERLEEDDIM
jgi:hypothetical protein